MKFRYLIIAKNGVGEIVADFETDDFYQAQSTEIKYMKKYKYVQSYVRMK